MPFGIRPSNVRVCHSTTRAFEFGMRQKSSVNLRLLATWSLLLLLLMIVIERNQHQITNAGIPDVKSTDPWLGF